MNRRLSYRPPIAALLLALSAQAGAGPDAFIDLDISAGLDDNVTRAQANRDIEHDSFLSATGTYSQPLWRDRSGFANFSGGMTAQQWNEFDGLNNISLRLNVDYVYAPDPSFGAPWFAISAGYTLQEFDSFLRDSDIYTLGGNLGFQIDDITNFRSGLTFKLRESDGVAFDTQDVSLFVNIDWSLERAGIEFLRHTTFYTTYKVQLGDVFSTASTTTAFSSGAPLWLAVASSSVPKDQPDDVFGGIVYRLDSTTHLLTLGLNFKLDLQRAWDVSVRVLSTETDIGLEYENLAITASYFHKFGIKF